MNWMGWNAWEGMTFKGRTLCGDKEHKLTSFATHSANIALWRWCRVKLQCAARPCCKARKKKKTLKCFCTRASISETTEETITQSVSSLMTQKHKEYMPQQRTSKGYTIVLQRSWQHQVSPFIFVKQMFFYHVISGGKEARATLRASSSERYSLVGGWYPCIC